MEMVYYGKLREKEFIYSNTRLIVAMIYNRHRGAKEKHLRVEEIIKLSTDTGYEIDWDWIAEQNEKSKTAWQM